MVDETLLARPHVRKLYEITLPIYDNSGKQTETAHNLFKKVILETVGGYSTSSGYGTWRDETGHIYEDKNIVYRIACEYHIFEREILPKAFELFPDQLAIFHGDVGWAWTTARAS
jgi:hypothetical protein